MSPPATAPAPPGPTSRRIGRAEIVALGRSGKPWAFLPIALQALRIAPADAELMLLAAANLARLGLATPARQLLAGLPDTLRDDPGVATVRRAIETLPEDRQPASALLQACRSNLDALGPRAPDLAAHLDRWSMSLPDWEWLRAGDGNIVRRPTGSLDPREWRGLADHRSAADRLVQQHIAGREPPGALYIEGLDPPWVALAIARATPAAKDGYAPQIVLVQADAQELLDGLAHTDLRAHLADPRLTLLVGPDAPERVGALLAERMERRTSGPYIPLHTLRTRAEPPLERVLQGADRAQVAEHERLAAQAARLYAGRDRAWWRSRFDEALAPGSAKPLRVLVPTCRYSTYIQHASRDLVEALRARGCDARLLIEPDDHARFSSLAYLRPIVAHEPDLVILINYTRANLGSWLPRHLPFVCWIQDAMPHQFDARIGAAQGDLDFLVGHLHRELFDRFGFPRARALSMPVVASARKFHDGPVSPAARERFECEIALVSHHSETPEAMHARLVREAGTEGLARAALERLWPRVREIAADAMGRSPPWRLEQATREALREAAGREPTPEAVTLLAKQHALPVADRLMRHEALAWAAAICDRRGWRLRLYGRGWDAHPRFSPFARGTLAHGEELRSAYRCAAVNLHVSLTTLVHQRVMECALSGGLPLCRLHSGALSLVTGAAQQAAARAGDPAACELDRRLLGWRIADSPELMSLTGQLQRLGLPVGEFCFAKPERAAALAQGPTIAPFERPDWLLGDLSETTFIDEASLERLVERALRAPAWRADLSRAMADRVKGHLTHEVLVGRMLDLVHASLA